MKRYCQTLDLREDPELIRRYRELHSPQGIWPEILQGIRDKKWKSGCEEHASS